jgi:4-hydroxybenzoate polyprenyltransferase
MARSPLSSAPREQPDPAGEDRPGRSLATSVVQSLRPRQWTKNLPVFAGVIFAKRLLDTGAVASATLGFVIFCALSGVVYLVNDVLDREADRLHPIKRRRPIASGDLPPSKAVGLATVLTVASLSAALWLSATFALIAVTYLVLMVVYSTTLKHMVILDVLTIAIGFVLRAWGGAVVIDVSMSHWLLLLTLLGALFLGMSKRRAELTTLAGGAVGHRRSLAEYSPYLLDQMIGVVTASTLLAYAFYTIAPETIAWFGTDLLVLTVPFPLYGIFRYLYLVHKREGGGDPSELLLTDRPLLACVALWGIAVILIVYGPANMALGLLKD